MQNQVFSLAPATFGEVQFHCWDVGMPLVGYSSVPLGRRGALELEVDLDLL